MLTIAQLSIKLSEMPANVQDMARRMRKVYQREIVVARVLDGQAYSVTVADNINEAVAEIELGASKRIIDFTH